jgi:NAD(P) transhydrogenase subunit alpha
MGTLTVGVVRERVPDEHRVALVPDSVLRLRSTGIEVLVETGAGTAASFTDSAYAAAGAIIVSMGELLAHSDVLLCVGPPEFDFRPGQTVVGSLESLTRSDLVRRFAQQGVTAVGLDMPPCRLTSSAAYAHNVVALLGQLVHSGELVIDLTDQVQSAVVVTHKGTVVT